VSEALIRRWRALAGPNAEAVGTALVDAWNESHRHYHGQGHLVWLLDEAERRVDLIVEPAFVGFASWFHDAIYTPGALDNEARSAAWAREAIAEEPLAERVARVIEMTRNHAQGEATGDAALFLDMDVAILGAPSRDYRRYAAGVRREFAVYPDNAFAAGRARFLEEQLQASRLFRSDIYERELAEQARANLNWELAEMRAGRMVTA
jgi:predicted metal-dependent HD superfamily phosphohydrolase